MKGNGIQDVTLIPGQSYNITSYFGCYRDGVVAQRYGGSNPDVMKGAANWGCRGSKQGVAGKVGVNYWSVNKYIESEANDIVEQQTTVLLLEYAKTLTLASTAALAVAVLAY